LPRFTIEFRVPAACSTPVVAFLQLGFLWARPDHRSDSPYFLTMTHGHAVRFSRPLKLRSRALRAVSNHEADRAGRSRRSTVAVLAGAALPSPALPPNPCSELLPARSSCLAGGVPNLPSPRMANLRRDRARRSYRSILSNCLAPPERIAANLCGPSGPEDFSSARSRPIQLRSASIHGEAHPQIGLAHETRPTGDAARRWQPGPLVASCRGYG
jgi:hypothetical protein